MKNLDNADGLFLVAVIEGEVTIADVVDGHALPPANFQQDGLGVHESAIELVTRIKTVLAGVAYQESMLAAEIVEGEITP